MSAEPTSDSARVAFDAWLSELPTEVRGLRLSVRDPFSTWLEGLSEEAATFAESQIVSADESDEDNQSAIRYAAVIVHSGEFPVVKLVKTAGRLAQLLGELVGQDVSVACFRGYFLPITAGPRRFVIIGDRALSLPLPGEEPREVPVEDIFDDLVIQEDGFIGPEELANTHEAPATDANG